MEMTEKERLEREHSKKMNDEAVERIKREASAEEIKRIEKAFFEDDEVITLRDGMSYRIPPCNLRDARKLMKLLQTVNVDAIIINFVPTGDSELDAQRENNLFTILGMAFKNYPHISKRNAETGEYEVNKEYLDEYVDLTLARKIIDILIGLNGLKK